MTSCKDPGFAADDFKRVIDHAKICGFDVKRKTQTQPIRSPDDLPSPGQLRILEHLWEDFAHFCPGAHSYRFRQGFARRVVGRAWPQTRREVNMMIEALKARLRREYQKS
jgi:hypothetical protein